MKAKHTLYLVLILALLASIWAVPAGADNPGISAGPAQPEERGYAPASPAAPIINELACPVGYVKTTLLSEDFETWPAPDWSIVDNGGTCVWDTNTFWGRTNYAGGDGQCADADSDACGLGTTMNTELWSPAVDLSGGGMVLFGYVSSFNYLGSAGEFAATDISTDGGATWTNLVMWQVDHSAYGPGEVVELDISAFTGSPNTHVRFHYYAPGWDWWYEVDQVEIALCEPAAGLYLEPEYQEGAQEPGTSAPYDLELLNFTGVEDLVLLTYTPSGPGTCYGPAISDPIPDTGTWPFQVMVDVDPSAMDGEVVGCQIDALGLISGQSDTAFVDVTATFPVEAYALDVYPGLNLVHWPDLRVPGTWDIIGSVPQFHPAADFLGDDYSVLYALDYDTNQFVSIDTATGARTVIGTSTPTGNWSGMTGTADGSTLYAASANCGVESYLYEVDPATGGLTLIGPMRPGSCMIDIAINAAGELYGVDIVDDSLYSINPATGAATYIGSTGASANYAQGMDFDYDSGILYWAAYTTQGELRTLNTSTGMSTLIGPFPGGNEVDGLAIVSGAPPDMTLHVGGIKGHFDGPQLRSNVLVLDGSDAPVPGAEVLAKFRAPGWPRPYMGMRMTNLMGMARFVMRSPLAGSWKICVEDITLAGYTYDPMSNVITCKEWIH